LKATYNLALNIQRRIKHRIKYLFKLGTQVVTCMFSDVTG